MKKKDRVSIDKIKRLVIIALVSDDYLMETLVLKGGNAVSVAYRLSFRASFDLDYSIPDDFDDLEDVKRRMEKLITETFSQENLHVFDFNFQERPKKSNKATEDFWGGYNITFKFIEEEIRKALGDNPDMSKLRREAIPVNPNHSRKVSIDISKHEYVDDRQEVEIGGFSVSVYAPRLLIFEKVRAICQQLSEYAIIVPSLTPRQRSKDFYDIYVLMREFNVNVSTQESTDVLRRVFDAKQVPYNFLKKISKEREKHRADFPSVVDTLSPEERKRLKDFDFYFDFVIKHFSNALG